MIRVEKIGSGNWYWSFASQDKKNKQDTFANMQAENTKLGETVQELRQKIAGMAAQKEEEEEEMQDAGAESREEVTAKKAVLEADLTSLQQELESYKDNDPVELERKQKEAKSMAMEVEQVTDDIYSLEKWFKDNSGGDEGLAAFRMGVYGTEWDTEEYQFKELVI